MRNGTLGSMAKKRVPSAVSEYMAKPLQQVVKHTVENVLGKMADAGLRHATMANALTVMQNLFTEAVENDYIPKSPCRRIDIPKCADAEETRPLTEAEVHLLFDGTTGRDRLVWRLLVLTGMRIGELLALRKSDVTADGLLVSKSVFNGAAARTKNGKPRPMPIPLPQVLREEIQAWAASVDGEALFPSPTGRLPARCGNVMQDVLARGRTCMVIARVECPILDRQQASVEELEARLTGKVVTIRQSA
jgi:integrase